MERILMGVCGGIAAYKAADIAHALFKLGFSVDVIMTGNATKFVTPLTFRTLTQNKVYTDLFDQQFETEVKHISLANRADIVLIAPATANFIGKLAGGIGDDMLSTVILAVKNKPVLIAPAMNTNMLENPIVQNNIKNLSSYGYHFVETKESLLACGDYGKGALADVDTIVKEVQKYAGE